MQISRPVIQADFQSTASAIAIAPSPARRWLTNARQAARWLIDIDDGAGAVTCFLCVLAVFGTLVVRLAELDHSLDAQSLKCSAVDKTTLQMHCEFE